MRRLNIIIMAFMAICLSCQDVHTDETKEEKTEVPVEDDGISESPEKISEGNGIYFWKSVFKLCDWETDFLRKHAISQLYVKMFDVSTDLDWNSGKTDVFPIATTRFKSPRPEGVTIIPSVYITVEALKHSAGQEESLAVKIVDRILAMVSFNNLGPVKTIQFDCDWTASTREIYFKLCRKAKKILKGKSILLSGTVRLHQLGENNLPFDMSVLMLYNLGGLTDYDTENSIIDYAELKKYVNKQMSLYNMDFAYPTFNWGVWFRNGKFKALLHKSDFSDTNYFQLLDANTYKVIETLSIEGHELNKDDVIRLETSDISQILKVKERVERMLGSSHHHNIIYHLDSANLSNYTDNEIKNIYSL